MRKVKTTGLLVVGLFIILHLSSCNKEDNGPTNFMTNPNAPNTPGSTPWSIPVSEVFDGGPGKDGIPALENPEKGGLSSGTYILDSELVLGYFDGVNAVAYPHKILDWHEIINDELSPFIFPFAITYCPLTGTGIGWERSGSGTTTTFGVSGLIYENNLIPYDRKTGSNWSQMRLDCVNGALIDTKVKTFPLVETSWKTWREMYPNTEVVTLNTGHDRSYDVYPYGDYKTNENFLLYPLRTVDRRLNGKERVHGIIIDGIAKAYRFGSFDANTSLINDVINGEDVVIVGNTARNFIVSFYSKLRDGSTPVFTAVDKNEVVLEDDLGNEWDVFGYAVSGPAKGQRLKTTESFIGYWFSWGTFYPDLEIYGK
ncbi:MAG: hypothetical protein DRI71_03325 [Bacteroidetes bacterium]|nr:MAG: hypothetical protein DRI71_03325 [Bacteroidota bacterium]